MKELEDRLLSKGMIANKKRPGRKSVINKRISNKSRQETLQALGIIEASKKLKERYVAKSIRQKEKLVDWLIVSSLNLDSGEAKILQKISLRNTALEDTCQEPVTCTESKYRTLDGSCNNIQHPNWGQANTIFQRLLPAHYGNGDANSTSVKLTN